jgi:L-lactate dehydrogenase (cytochrome)
MRAGEIAALLRGKRFRGPYGKHSLLRCPSIDDLARRARRTLPLPASAYLEGGGEGEWTLRRNRAAFDEIEIRPRVLRDVSHVDLTTTVLGTTVPVPIALGPVGAPGFFHPEGELAVVRAAAKAGIPYGISTVATTAIDRIAREAPATLWFQLYVWGDRARNKELVDRARELGYHALLLSADVSVRSKREREERAGLSLPSPNPPLGAIFDTLVHPVWAWRFLTSRPPVFPNVNPHAGSVPGGWDLSGLFDGTVCWDDLAWIRDHWSGPVVLKGILSADDARRAADAGADGVIISNHGGRQLDHLPATIEVLPAIVDAVGDRIEVLLDSGIRRGTDILAALALGARAVLVGRAYLYGLAVAGEAGVRHAIDILVDELRTAMALSGATSVTELNNTWLQRRDASATPGTLHVEHPHGSCAKPRSST